MEEEQQKSKYRQLFKEFAKKSRNEAFLLALVRTIYPVTGKEDTGNGCWKFIDAEVATYRNSFLIASILSVPTGNKVREKEVLEV